MSIKKWVRITCDGPCGTVLEDNHVPEGWQLLQLTNNNAQKWTHRAHLCPKCTTRFLTMMGREGYGLAIPQSDEKSQLESQLDKPKVVTKVVTK